MPIRCYSSVRDDLASQRLVTKDVVLRRTNATPWTQELSLEWPPEVRFLEARVELLRLLEDQKRLKSFKVDETEISARLTDFAEMTVSVTGADLRILSPLHDAELPMAALRTVLETIRPASIRGCTERFSHVVPLAGDYRELCRSAGVGLYPWWPATLTDWALLVDGVAQRPDTTYQCEFGIVSDDEIADRLNRKAGRMGGRMSSAVITQLERITLPDVALFADSTWIMASAASPASIWDYISDFAAAITGEANDLVLGLHRAVTDTYAVRQHKGAS